VILPVVFLFKKIRPKDNFLNLLGACKPCQSSLHVPALYSSHSLPSSPPCALGPPSLLSSPGLFLFSTQRTAGLRIQPALPPARLQRPACGGFEELIGFAISPRSTPRLSHGNRFRRAGLALLPQCLPHLPGMRSTSRPLSWTGCGARYGDSISGMPWLCRRIGPAPIIRNCKSLCPYLG